MAASRTVLRAMPRRPLTLALLVLAALTAVLVARSGGGPTSVPIGVGVQSPPNPTGTPVLVGSTPRHATDAAPVQQPWWIEANIESLNPDVRSARLEARWWPGKPSSPYEGAAAVFGADASLVEGKARVRVTGDASPGWAVLFVVEDGRPRLAYPWISEPVSEVAAGRGCGPVVDLPVLVGARSLKLRLLDREDLPLAGAEVEVHDPERDLRQAATTGPDGRVCIDALGADEVRVSWRVLPSLQAPTPFTPPPRRWPERSGYPYGDGEPRSVRVEGSEVVLRVPRRALLRVRGRIAGAPEEAWLPIDTYGLSTNRPGRNVGTTANSASHGIWVDPGPYRVAHHLGSVATPALEADQERTVDLPATVPSGAGWLDVGFDLRALPGDSRVACATEARRVREGGGWQGGQVTAPHDRALLILPPGAYEVTGAIRTEGTVRFSMARRVEIRADEGTSVTLATAPAGALRLPGPDRGRECEIVERAFPLTGVVTASTFRFVGVSWPHEMTTWWLPAGSYVLRQWDDDEPGAEHRLGFEVQEGAVTTLVQDANRWFTDPAR